VNPKQAIITRLTRLSDTSLIVHWFTEDQGLIKTIARGARRPKSPFAGKLDLFFSGEISVMPARRGELHTLREVAIDHWREGLRRSYTSTLLAAYCCQLLESAVEAEAPDPPLHDLLHRALDHLDTTPASVRALHHFEAELAKLLGVSQSGKDASISLRDALGTLPANRREFLERLSPTNAFSSSAL
jgi:DNA repair protein RecO (recombination protein O)